MTWKNIIIDRTIKLRQTLDKIKSNRQKLDYLNNYAKNKTAIIVGTGPEYKNYIQEVKKKFNQNCILICFKQSIKDFDMICDFHIINTAHFEMYNYKNIQPIIIYIKRFRYFPRCIFPKLKKYDIYSDIYFYNSNSIFHIYRERIYIPEYLNTSEKVLDLDDNNIGSHENMTIQDGHIMYEIGLPLSIHIACKTIITLGWVGGMDHGTNITNQRNWENNKYKYNILQQQQNYEYSEYLSS